MDSGLKLIADHINGNAVDIDRCTVNLNGISDHVLISRDDLIIHVFCYDDREVKKDKYQGYITVNDTEVKLSMVRKWYKDPEKLAKYIVKQLKKL